jgi:putative 4-mercaptohistidine N1-methyltranferase
MSTATSRDDFPAFSSDAEKNPYETERLLGEYLLFHYGSDEEIVGFKNGPVSALGYPVRCVEECLDTAILSEGARALDLGCAVGRSSFELSRSCAEVLGVDYSHSFVRAAETLRTQGSLAYLRRDEGDLQTPLIAHRPDGVSPKKVAFEQGDAMALRTGLGQFDVILMANLIDRLSQPLKCLEQLGPLLHRGGQLIITSPYTWMEEYTPRSNWLGGFESGAARRTTFDGLQTALGGNFELVRTQELPFLIREHARKYQWSVAQATIWRRV